MFALLFIGLCAVAGYLVATSVFDILTGHRSAREIHHHHYYIDNRSVTLVQGYQRAHVKPNKRSISEL